jgi:transcriptional regulator with XRE-family HTH domain
MSIHISRSKRRIFRTENVNCSAVDMQKPESLAEFVRRVRNEKRLSLNDVQRQSGNQIANSYVSRIENGIVTNVTPEKLKALAKGLQVSEEEIFAVVRGKSPADNPNFKKWKFASLFDEAEQLTPEQMVRFEILMEMARREVQRMLQEQAEREPPRKLKRVPEGAVVIDTTQGKEKKRA